MLKSLNDSFLILAIITFFAACGTSSSSNSQLKNSDTKLQKAMEHWRGFSQFCEGFPSKENCDDGDALLFSSLLCASGEEVGCEGARLSQGRNGRFWRSPRRIGDNAGHENSFSRDMSMGVLTYLVATKDRPAAKKWLKWIENNKACPKHVHPRLGCILPKVAVVCDDEKISRHSTPFGTITTTTINPSCVITPSLWAQIHQVWKYLELPTTHAMRDNAWAEKTFVEETRLTPTGYGLHLKAASVFLKKRMGIKASQRREVNKILSRKQPDNPFFSYLAGGDRRKVRDQLLKLCPKPGEPVDFRQHQWAWERDTKEKAWRESMGWDCIFLANLLK